MDKVVHFEIPADDVKRAKKFYGETFGWKLEDYPGMDYTGAITVDVDEKTRMPKEPGAINGGMFKRGEMPAKSPVITIDVKDIANALESVKKHGGSVVRDKFAVGDMGFVAYFQDTEGNIVGLWQTARKS